MDKKTELKDLKLGEVKIIRSKDFADKVKPKSEVGVMFNINELTGLIYEGHINHKIFIFTPVDTDENSPNI